MKPKRSCRAITVMTVAAFVTTVFHALGDVADAIKKDAFGCSGGGDPSELADRLSTLWRGHPVCTELTSICEFMTHLPRSSRRFAFLTHVVLS